MDELPKAIINLINTGSALADDALYLFFLLKAIEALAFLSPITLAIVLGYKLLANHSQRKIASLLKRGTSQVLGEHCYYWLSDEYMVELGFVKSDKTG